MYPTRTILILVANPRQKNKRQFGVEAREITLGVQQSRGREKFTIQCEWAVGSHELRRAMLRFRPQIVHFCGYGRHSQGIELQHGESGVHLVSTQALSDLFRLCADCVECVFLSACYTDIQAEAISCHIKYVIGMKQEISQSAAISFSVGFYDALGAEKAYKEAFEFGCNAIQLSHSHEPNHVNENLIPVLKEKPALSSKMPTVLILEDNELWLSQHERWLKEGGLKCHVTQYAEEAIRIAQMDSSVKFALIDEILFVPSSSSETQYRQLQRWQGSGVIRESRLLRPDLQFIFVTSAPEQRSEGKSQLFRREVNRLKLMPGVIDVFHQQDIQENPGATYRRIIDLIQHPYKEFEPKKERVS